MTGKALAQPRRALPWAALVYQSPFMVELGHRPLGIGAAVVTGIVVLVAVLAPVIAPYDPAIQNLRSALLPPSSAHLLGTDEVGRDILSRVIYGSRVSLLVGVLAVGIGVLVGVPLGLMAGYVGKRLDNVIMRLVDAMICFPAVMLAMALAAVLGPNLFNVMIAIGVVYSPRFARLARGQALSLKQWEYVTAARSVGASGARIVRNHIWPNATAPIVVQATLSAATAILLEATLGFLGLGVPAPTPTWGSMLKSAYSYTQTAPWMALGPGVAIFLIVLSFNILGDVLRDASDPKTRRRTMTR